MLQRVYPQINLPSRIRMPMHGNHAALLTQLRIRIVRPTTIVIPSGVGRKADNAVEGPAFQGFFTRNTLDQQPPHASTSFAVWSWRVDSREEDQTF